MNLQAQIPHSALAEQATLGSIFLSPQESIAECVEKITPAHFYVPANQTIYQRLVDLWDGGGAVDLITFTQDLRDRDLLERVGGASYVTELTCIVPTAANIGYYLDIMREKFARREIILRCTDMARRAYDEDSDAAELLDRVQAEITALSIRHGEKTRAQHISALITDLEARIKHAFANRGDAAAAAGGLASGFYDLDRMTGGLKPQDLIVVGARTSHGKTSFLLNVAMHAAVNEGKAVAIFSMEMSAPAVADRLGASLAGFTLQRIRDGFFDRLDFKDIGRKLEPLKNSKIWVDDSPALWTSDFKARARRMVAGYGVQLVVVDYLQKMVSPSERAKRNRAIEVTEIAQCLKNVAKELSIPVLCAAQLNRQPGERKFGFPKLSDLRESGDIENEADICLLLWRPERECEGASDYANLAKKLGIFIGDTKEAKEKGAKIVVKDESERDQVLRQYARLIVAKQRNGPVNEIPVIFDGDRTTFHNVTPKEYSNRQDERQPGGGRGPSATDLLVAAKEIFPNAKVVSNNGEEKRK
jgi:replicative DNA helicase